MARVRVANRKKVGFQETINQPKVRSALPRDQQRPERLTLM